MRALLAVLALIGPAVSAETPGQVAQRYGLAGEMLIARGDTAPTDTAYGTIDPFGRTPHRAGERWRLASISKQVTATLLLHDFAADLDRPVAPMLAAPALGAVTLRQLLTHHSGLANPDDTPAGADGVPSFYKAAAPDHAFCLSKPAMATERFTYDNCDYLIAAMLFVAKGRAARHWPAGMIMATPGKASIPGFVKGKPEPAFSLASFGAAGGLTGTARDLLRFDRALMSGGLLTAATRAEMWRGDPRQGYQAIGQWVFPGRLKGCAASKRIVQRDGEIYGVQTRNYILPDDNLVVIVFTNRSSDDFAFGEIWEGKGFAYDLLSAAACA